LDSGYHWSMILLLANFHQISPLKTWFEPIQRIFHGKKCLEYARFWREKISKSLNFYAIIVKHGMAGASCGEIHGECLAWLHLLGRTGTMVLDPTFGSFILLESFFWWKCFDYLDWSRLF
jgi:hypothetical protein